MTCSDGNKEEYDEFYKAINVAKFERKEYENQHHEVENQGEIIKVINKLF